MSPYLAVANDLQWLRERWWMQPDSLAGSEIRRESAALRILLVEDLIGKSWRHHGFCKEPIVFGPHAERLATNAGVLLEHAASLIVGGGRINDLGMSMIGAFRVFNPSPGKGPEA